MTIKPTSMKNFAVSPGSSEEVLTQMVAACEALWRETHFESMVHRTIKLLQSTFQIPAFALLRLDKKADKFGCEAIPLRAQQAKEIPKELLDELIKEFQSMDLAAEDLGVGINSLLVKNQTIKFILLGEKEYEWFAFLWLDPEPTLSQDAILGEQSSRHYSSALALDFLVKQLQTTSRWFSRFSETQSLLHMDDLTGLYNHRYLEQAIEQEIKRSQRYDSSFCLLFIDLDDFKPINDQFGHLAGSQVLREVAQILKATVRDVDLVFRFGGDEFVVLLIESESRGGYRTAERIRERIQQTPFTVAHGNTAHVTASIGVAAFPEHGQEKDKLLALADECMYESKRNGKNRVVVVGSSLSGTGAEPKKDKAQWDSN